MNTMSPLRWRPPATTPTPATTPNPASAYLARLSPGSRPSQASALRQLATYLGAPSPLDVNWPSLSAADVLALREACVTRYAPKTARRMLSALKGVLSQSWRSGALSREELARLTDVPAIKGTVRKPGRMLAPEEVERLLDGASPRDRALVLTMLSGGLRRAEAACLARDGVIDDAPGVLRLRFMGKGGKQRTVFLAGRAAAALTAWLRVSPWEEGGVFGLTVAGMAKRFAHLARWTGVRFTPHDLRRTYASRALNSGADIASVQASMGHADPRTTAGYDRRGDDALRAVAQAAAF